MHILNRHLYRASTSLDEDNPAITILFSALRRAVNTHQQQQELIESTSDINKRQYNEMDPINEVFAQAAARLKKKRRTWLLSTWPCTPWQVS